MEVLQQYFTGHNGPALQLVAIALSLIVCLALIVWIVRRIAGSSSPKSARGRIRRLSVSDTAQVDEKRYVVLVRRDNVEHLVMIGGNSDVVIEQGIVRVEPMSAPAEPAVQAAKQKTNGFAKKLDTEPAKPAVAEKSEPAPTPSKAKSEPAKEAVENTAAAPVAAAVAAVATTAVAQAKDEVAETATNVADTAAQAVSETAEAEDTLEQVVAEQIDDLEITPEPEATITEAPGDVTAEPATTDGEPVVEMTEPAPDLTPNLEDTITQQLDDALSSETFEVETPSEPATVAANGNIGSEDEMQRLLDELAGEAKQGT